MPAADALYRLGDLERCLHQSQNLTRAVGRALLPPPHELRLIVTEEQKQAARELAEALGGYLVEAATHLGKLEHELRPTVVGGV
jgi:hypothetical protein